MQIIPISTEQSPLSNQQNFNYFQCPICFSYDFEDKLLQLTECGHIFCRSCIKDYLETEIASFKVLKIKCPQEDCQYNLKENLIGKILDKETFENYQRLVLQKMSHRTSAIKYCPKPGCLKPFTPSKSSPYSICHCQTLICNLCGDYWHEGKACLEALDPEFEIYAKENNLKYCIMCRSVIDRVEG